MTEPAPQTKTDSKPQPPPAPVKPKLPEGCIRVKSLRFARPGGHDLPGGHGLSRIESTYGPSNKARWEVVFDARIRHHRITYYPPGNQPGETAEVPAEWGWFVREE